MHNEHTTHVKSPGPTVGKTRINKTAIAILVLVIGWVTAMYYRNTLRAMWWSYRLTTSSSIAERDYFVVRLASLGDRAMAGMPRVLNDPRTEIRLAGIQILRFCSDSCAVPNLLDMLDETDDDLVSQATVELVRRGHTRDVLDRLTPLMAQPQKKDIRPAASALSRIGGREAETLLIDALRCRPDANATAQIIDSLAMLECRRAVPLIETYRNDQRRVTIPPASCRAARSAIEHLRSELLARQTDPNGLLQATDLEPTVAAVAQRALQFLQPGASPTTTQAAP